LDWLTEHPLPIGDNANIAVDWLTNNFGWFFDWLSNVLAAIIDALLWMLETPHPFVVIAVIAALSFLVRRSIVVTLFTALGLLLIVNLGYWKDTVETLSLVVAATLVCMVIGVPMGIAAARRRWIYTIVRPILDLMQTIPTFVYLIPTLVLFGLGMVPGLISTVIFAIAAPVRLTHLGVSSVPLQLHEAGLAFGATKRQLLWKVEIPFALPTIMAGITQCIMLSLSMVVIAALVGADGLGKPVVRALNTVNVSMGFEAGIAIVVLAILLDRVCKWPARKLRGSR
jgi:glycine betaine/proline transport system permease protein